MSLYSKLLVSTAVLVAAGPALAGGFAIREQSTVFQGSSFAGNAAGGALSSMFWNPAALAEFNSGISIEAAAAYIVPNTSINAVGQSAACPAPALGGVCTAADSGNIGKNAVVPSSYLAYALSKDLVVGVSMNAPFGLSTGPSGLWAGSPQAANSDIRSLNITPTVAYNILPNLSIGAGLQIERMSGKLGTFTSVATPTAQVEGRDWAIGWTAGLLWKPFTATAIGVGYRSAVNHTLDGTVGFTGSPVRSGELSIANLGTAGVKLAVNTPETVTFSVRQGITSQLTALFSAEWANWSKFDKLDIICTTGANVAAPLGCGGGAGTLQGSLPLGWHDGWMIAGGLEYLLIPGWTVRSGVAWEKSPVQNAAERSPRLPDSDRIWGSIGASVAVNNSLTLDAAYSHVWLDGGPLDRTTTVSGAPYRLVGTVDSSLDIISIGARIKW
jgi:long-chain fatty acid transport protein